MWCRHVSSAPEGNGHECRGHYIRITYTCSTFTAHIYSTYTKSCMKAECIEAVACSIIASVCSSHPAFVTLLGCFFGFIGFCQETQSGMAVACFAPFLAPEYTEGKKRSCKHTMHVCANESSSITPACKTLVASVPTASILRQMCHVYVCMHARVCIEKLRREGDSIH